mgnify:CR=1 FL=1
MTRTILPRDDEPCTAMALHYDECGRPARDLAPCGKRGCEEGAHRAVRAVAAIAARRRAEDAVRPRNNGVLLPGAKAWEIVVRYDDRDSRHTRVAKTREMAVLWVAAAWQVRGFGVAAGADGVDLVACREERREVAGGA